MDTYTGTIHKDRNDFACELLTEKGNLAAYWWMPTMEEAKASFASHIPVTVIG